MRFKEPCVVCTEDGQEERVHEVEPRPDWFHVAMRLTMLPQTAKGWPDQSRDVEKDDPLRDQVVRDLERLKYWP
jgi:hypothetical protein